MPITTLPALDAQICSGWTEQQINLYNALPFYFAKVQVDMKQTWPTWSKLVGKIRWQPNMGPTMRTVRKEPSPHLRQFFTPNEMATLPRKDVIDVRELTVDVQVYRHRFESPVINFLPSFRDFLRDHVDFHVKDITEKQLRADDIYIRGRVFHESPFVFLPDRAAGELVSAPIGVPNNSGGGTGFQASTVAKTTDWLQIRIAEIGNPGNLSFNAINLALTILENDIRVPYYSGSQLPKEDQGLAGKYCLVLSGEAWNQFIYDPWMLANKPIDLDVVHNGWKGSIFGRITAKLEDLPLRIAADGTFPNPQLREGNPDSYNIGESVNNPTYNNAPFEVAFLVGSQGYDAIEVGPPPAPFAESGMPEGFGKMFWNGEVQLTKNILVECLDESGNRVYDTNNYGEYLKLISQVTYGALPRQRRSVLPIIYKRKRGA